MITITKILDPFLPASNIIEVEEYDSNKKLYHYLTDIPLDRSLCANEVDKEMTFVVAVNGSIIKYDKPQDLYIDIEDDSYISVCVSVGADMGATAIAALVTGITAGEALLTASAMAGMAYYAVYAISYVAITYGASVLLGMLVPDEPDYDNTTDPTYSWGDLAQTNQEGLVIPYVYGTSKMSGNVINQYVDVDEDDNEILYVMMGLCDHEVDSITDIRINDQASTYYEDTTTEVRLGTANDALIDGFDEIATQTDVGSLLTANTVNTKTTDGDCEKIIVRVSAPNGIFYYDSEGKPSTILAVHKVAYKDVSGADYITHSVVVCGPTSIISAGINTTNFVGDTVEADNSFGYKYIFDSGQTETERQQFITDNTDFFDSSDRADLGETSSKSYKTTIDNLTLSQYNIQVTRINKEWEGSKENSDIYFNSFQERVKQSLIYPGLAKYSVIALATDQISGGMPSFTCTVANSTVSVYNQDTLANEDKDATNPAWIVYDLLVNKAGVDDSEIIWEEFDYWATWCEDNDMLIGGIVFATESNFWAELQRVAVLGRGAIIRRGIKYGVFIDRSDTTISHLFTSSGNIVKDSLNITWLPKADIANAIEIEYTDPDRDYTRQVVSIISEDYLTSDDTNSAKMSIKFDAAVSEDYVKSEGIFRMNCNKWLTKTISFDAYTDSFACTVGDLFYFQHDLPNYADGYSGRLIESGNDNGSGSPYITLDKKVSLDNTQVNMILIRLGDGTFVEKTLTVDDTEEYNTFVVDSVFSTVPSKYDLYSIGPLESIKKTYRLISIDRKDDFVRSLVGLEYIDAIYTDRSGTIIDVPYWEKVTQEALNVQLNEILAFNKDGSYRSNLNVSWTSSLGENVRHGWDVYIEDVTAGTTYTQITTGSTKTAYAITDYNFIVGRTYKVTVVPNTQGYNSTGFNQASITLEGKLAPPSDVAGFNSQWNGIDRVVNFVWSHIDDIDKDRYEIRDMGDDISGQTTWDLGTKVKETTSDSTSIYIPNGIDGVKYYGIKAIDTSGIYSDNAAVDTLSLNTSGTDLDIPSGLTLSTGSSIAADGTDTVFIQADWDDNTDADFKEFVIELEDIALAFPAEYKTTNSDYFWQPVKANTEYGARVRSVDMGDNSSAYSAQVTITTAVDTEPPPVPTWDADIDIVPGFKVMGLNWDKSTALDLAYYEFRRSITGAFAGEEFESGPIDSSYIADTQLEVDTTYYYQIRATDLSGNTSDWSDSRSATTLQVGTEDIAYNAIIANHINVVNLEALNTNTGNLVVDVGGSISSGKTSYVDTSNGYWMENDSILGARMNIGGSTKYMRWTGDDLEIGGDIVASGNIQASAVITDSIADGAVTEATSTYMTTTTTVGTTLTTITSATISASSGDSIFIWSGWVDDPGISDADNRYEEPIDYKLYNGSTYLKDASSFITYTPTTSGNITLTIKAICPGAFIEDGSVYEYTLALFVAKK